MPYIPKKDRERYVYDLEIITTKLAAVDWNVGHVNFVISTILWKWFEMNKSYETVCKIRGTISSVGAEFYRRKAADYEDRALKLNGDLEVEE